MVEVPNHQKLFVSDKYRKEVPLNIDTVKDRGVRGGEGLGTPGTPWLCPCILSCKQYSAAVLT